MFKNFMKISSCLLYRMKSSIKRDVESDAIGRKKKENVDTNKSFKFLVSEKFVDNINVILSQNEVFTWILLEEKEEFWQCQRKERS